MMNSKITIEVSFHDAKPYFRVKTDKQSDDLRDKLISRFRELLGHTSNWARVRFDDTAVSGFTHFTLEPISPDELRNELTLMEERIRFQEDNNMPTMVH